MRSTRTCPHHFVDKCILSNAEMRARQGDASTPQGGVFPLNKQGAQSDNAVLRSIYALQ